eukprot:1343996-Rhodomonas_salina.1
MLCLSVHPKPALSLELTNYEQSRVDSGGFKTQGWRPSTGTLWAKSYAFSEPYTRSVLVNYYRLRVGGHSDIGVGGYRSTGGGRTRVWA